MRVPVAPLAPGRGGTIHGSMHPCVVPLVPCVVALSMSTFLASFFSVYHDVDDHEPFGDGEEEDLSGAAFVT